ncbi:NOT2 / NOT3 / NOT5 family protein [Ancylostoma ceylanicum]|uniref:NOT2 / NOT3 / NOT5 family protein n=3 Tax=Ancylostoma ceylanicum TaxID=53326 RepID=A0A0D6LUF5_9BILA|nr:NOT2 / NOT3 / NOT5 family protein [Ancylostoma ceylanicum]
MQMTAANDMPVSSAAAAAAAAASSDPFGVRPAGEPARGIITHPDGEVSNIPPTMLADQFGMAGLVTYLRTVDNPSIVSLALGYDLTTLGLNLNLSERHLYTSFGGPWADNPIRPHELDVKVSCSPVPDDYLTNAQIREKLPPVKLNKLSEDVLFYLFYNCPGEVYQLAAACELYQRDWRFHKSDGNWLTRSQYGGVKEQTGSYEKGQYNVFDPLQWRKIPKELKLEYKELEERPKLPAMFGGGGGAAATSMGTSAPRPAS